MSLNNCVLSEVNSWLIECGPFSRIKGKYSNNKNKFHKTNTFFLIFVEIQNKFLFANKYKIKDNFIFGINFNNFPPDKSSFKVCFC